MNSSERFQELRHQLTTPIVFPGQIPIGREAQFKIMQERLKQYCYRKRGGGMYICGLPGTGKSMTVHSVLLSLAAILSHGVYPPALISLNCMVLLSPGMVFQAILEGYNQHSTLTDSNQIYYIRQLPPQSSRQRNVQDRVHQLVNLELSEAKEAEKRPLTGRKRLKQDSKDAIRGMIVIFLDEMDHLIAKDTSLLNELFAMAVESKRLILIGASNSLDLGERLQSGPEIEIITFPAYTSKEVAAVLKKVVEDCSKKMLSDRGIEFLARKSSTSGMGDMRNVIHICLSSLTNLEASKEEDSIVDVKDLVKIFEGSAMLKEDSKHGQLSSLPLDQQVMLFALYQQTQLLDKSLEEEPKKKRATGQKLHLDPLNLVQVYQKYMETCAALSIDASSKSDFSVMNTMLVDIGLITNEKRKKQTLVRLKISNDVLQEFFTTSRLFTRLL